MTKLSKILKEMVLEHATPQLEDRCSTIEEEQGKSMSSTVASEATGLKPRRHLVTDMYQNKREIQYCMTHMEHEKYE